MPFGNIFTKRHFFYEKKRKMTFFLEYILWEDKKGFKKRGVIWFKLKLVKKKNGEIK